MKELVRAKVIIRGLVQGVGFRYFIRRHAQKLGVKGWAKNTEDYVEAVFEGGKENVVKLVELCKDGPLFSKVDSVDVEWQKYVGKFDRFEIRF